MICDFVALGLNLMEQNIDIRQLAITFAINVSDLCDTIVGCKIFTEQLVRSSSSIGANVSEAKYAQSNVDFINKLEVALKECYESDYWLELLYLKKRMTSDIYENLKNQCGVIRRKLISSVTTAKKNLNKRA